MIDNMKGATTFKDQAALVDAIKFRKAIVDAAKMAGKLQFTAQNLATENDSKNWQQCSDGVGITLKQGSKPSDAIDEIFAHPEKFAFDCATMQIVICLKGIRDYLGADEFNKRFSTLELKGFENNKREGDPLYGIIVRFGKQDDWPGIRPGDRVTFKNPDARQAAWKIENTIYLGDGKFYAPGLAPDKGNILSKDDVIAALNSLRTAGSTTSAYMDPVIGSTIPPKPKQ